MLVRYSLIPALVLGVPFPQPDDAEGEELNCPTEAGDPYCDEFPQNCITFQGPIDSRCPHVDLGSQIMKRTFFKAILHVDTMERRADGWPVGLCLKPKKKGECLSGWTYHEDEDCCTSNCNFLPFYYNDMEHFSTKLTCHNDQWELNNFSTCCRLKKFCNNPDLELNGLTKHVPKCLRGSGGWKCMCIPDEDTDAFIQYHNDPDNYNPDPWWYDPWAQCCFVDDATNTAKFRNNFFGKGMLHEKSFDDRYNNDSIVDLNTWPDQAISMAMLNWRIRYASRPKGNKEGWHWYPDQPQAHDHRHDVQPHYPRDPNSPQFPGHTLPESDDSSSSSDTSADTSADTVSDNANSLDESPEPTEDPAVSDENSGGPGDLLSAGELIFDSGPGAAGGNSLDEIVWGNGRR
jgi:hypothetical protein